VLVKRKQIPVPCKARSLTFQCTWEIPELLKGWRTQFQYTPNQYGALTIGTRSDNVLPFEGGVDEVALYTGTLFGGLEKGVTVPLPICPNWFMPQSQHWSCKRAALPPCVCRFAALAHWL
jgi:hypothetical protein